MKVDDLLQALTATKRDALVIILIFVAIFVTNNLSFFKSISINFTGNNAESEDNTVKSKAKQEKTTDIDENLFRISILDVSYQNEFINSPSYLLFKVQNNSDSSVGSLDKIKIKVVHGENDLMNAVASPSDIEISNIGDSIIEFSKMNFNKEGILSIYVLLQRQSFERIEINVDKNNISKDFIFTLSDLRINKNQQDDFRLYNFSVFLLLVLGGVVLVFVIGALYYIGRKIWPLRS